MAVTVPEPGLKQRAGQQDELVRIWRDRIQRAKEARKPFERIWLSNLAFAAGQHWLVYDSRNGGRMRHVQDVDPRQRDRILYTADRIGEYLQAQYGELNSDDDRPELLTAQDGDSAEEIAKALNLASQHEWDNEAHAADALMRARLFCLTMGVSAVRRRFDPTRGPVTDHQPVDQQGQPIKDPETLQYLEQNGHMPDGSLPRFQPVNEGRSILEAYTAFQILTPPGVVHEDEFPWEIIVRPVLLDDLRDEYGAAAANLTEDTDIASASGLSMGQNLAASMAGMSPGTGGGTARLRDHCWLYTGFRRPCRQYPEGQKVVLASNQYTLLDAKEQLPYLAPDGTRKSGVVYFHWWRLADRFQSRSFIEPLKDPQRLINETESMVAEIIARGGPKAFVEEGSVVQNPTGAPMETVQFKQGSPKPDIFQGVPVGQWLYEQLNHLADNLTHASTLSQVRLGETPPGANTYSSLVLLNQSDSMKRDPIHSDHRRQIARLVEYGVHDIREWWPDTKMVQVSGDEGQISRQEFRKSTIPDFYVAKVPAGSAVPRMQAAEVAKIDTIWQAAHASGVVGLNPQQWVAWYAASIAASQAQDIPEQPRDSQEEVAAHENFLMLRGEQVAPAPHDIQPVHIPIHREALDQARAGDDVQAVELIETHIAASIEMTAQARKTLRAADPADVNDLATDLALDEDEALRENDMLIQGIPLNPEEADKAMGALQQGLNPETGQPLTATDDPRMLLERATLKPKMVENLQVHMDRHGKVIKSRQFQAFPPDVRQRFLTHWDLTRDLWLSLLSMPDHVEPPKVNLTVRESVGPTTVAQILRRAGVPDADAHTLATEEPMENLISRDDTPAGGTTADKAAGKKPGQKPTGN